MDFLAFWGQKFQNPDFDPPWVPQKNFFLKKKKLLPSSWRFSQAMTPLTEFSEKNHFLGPKVAAIDPCLIEISLCAQGP